MALLIAVGCAPCVDGYVQQDDGTCADTRVTPVERDTGGNVDTGRSFTEPVPVVGTVLRNGASLEGVLALDVEVWGGRDMTPYGPNAARGDPLDWAPVNLEVLAAIGEVAFALEADDVRGAGVYGFAVVRYSESVVRYVDAADNPYATGDGEVDMVIDLAGDDAASR